MDKFEQFFTENRLRLDTENLDAAFSEKIAGSVRHLNRRRLVSRIYTVTSMAAIMIMAVVIYLNYPGNEKQPVQNGVFSKIATDLVKEEDSYIKLINLSESVIRKQEVPAEYEPMFREFTQQLQIIDRQYEIYKAQVEKDGYSDEIIQQIMYNYQLKLSVLQTLQSEINKINKLSNTKSHESEKIKFNL
jgi:hypothetical protein